MSYAELKIQRHIQIDSSAVEELFQKILFVIARLTTLFCCLYSIIFGRDSKGERLRNFHNSGITSPLLEMLKAYRVHKRTFWKNIISRDNRSLKIRAEQWSLSEIIYLDISLWNCAKVFRVNESWEYSISDNLIWMFFIIGRRKSCLFEKLLRIHLKEFAYL